MTDASSKLDNKIATLQSSELYSYVGYRTSVSLTLFCNVATRSNYYFVANHKSNKFYTILNI